jgi:aerobic-type carbon monoxide dehydrogenase small subunit (CoxS/CutS family)
VNDKAVRSCVTSVGDLDGKHVVTIEGLARNGDLHPVQEAFATQLGFQCGYCTPGMITRAYAFLLQNPEPTRDQILREMGGHLCRCGAHVQIVQAIEIAAATMEGGT